MRGMPVPVFLRAPEGNPFGVTTPRHPGDAVSTTPPTNTPPTWVEPVTGCTIKYTEKTERVFSGIPFYRDQRDKTVEDLYQESLEQSSDSSTVKPDAKSKASIDSKHIPEDKD